MDVRVLVATNRDPDELVRTGRLRADLLHRIDVIRITLPPLRERPEDVPRLVEHFLAPHRRRGLGAHALTPGALRVLQGYPWPGNVRELANTIERLMILSAGPVIDVEDLPENSPLGPGPVGRRRGAHAGRAGAAAHRPRPAEHEGQPDAGGPAARRGSRHAEPEAEAVGRGRARSDPAADPGLPVIAS